MECIIIIIAVVYLRKAFKTALTMPQWNKRLLGFLFISIALLIAQSESGTQKTIALWLSIFELSILLFIIHKKFREAEFFITAAAPILLVDFITESLRLASPNLFQTIKIWIAAAQFFAILWGIGTWIMTRRQQKQLAAARAKAIEEEENSRLIAVRKTELEMLVAERTAEITKQKEELEVTVNELKSAQAQLIQSEKMASLGELTAGIAHEIQNPLNFVNNFSDVNNELIDEMLDEILHSNGEEAKLIAKDIKENNSKIIFHGKRADSIVKGMLQHSRKSTGQKELTDINALCDEYLRLSYHGLRAKDKSFNAEFRTSFDESIGKINVVPQDMGRVLLNLINNAFYAVNEKNQQSAANSSQLLLNKYKPVVEVKTKKLNDAVEISVTDNGSGISQQVIDKIFNPFFTTKPTGQGTGLGLSLTYDIITKQHDGTINVESKEGEGTTFVIELPVG